MAKTTATESTSVFVVVVLKDWMKGRQTACPPWTVFKCDWSLWKINHFSLPQDDEREQGSGSTLVCRGVLYFPADQWCLWRFPLSAEGRGGTSFLPADHLRGVVLPPSHGRAPRPQTREPAPGWAGRRQDCWLWWGGLPGVPTRRGWKTSVLSPSGRGSFKATWSLCRRCFVCVCVLLLLLL